MRERELLWDIPNLKPGAVFISASLPADALVSLDHPGTERRLFDLFEPIPMDMLPVRDRDHLASLIRWGIYVHDSGLRGTMHRLVHKDVIKHKVVWELDSVEVVDVRRLSLLLGLVQVFDLSAMNVYTECFDGFVEAVGVFSENTNTAHWTFGILQAFINFVQLQRPCLSLPCPELAITYRLTLDFAYAELPTLAAGCFDCAVMDLTTQIILTEEDEDIIYGIK